MHKTRESIDEQQKALRGIDGNYEMTKVRYTKFFLAWLAEETIENQSRFEIGDLYEIYINSICWNEIPRDPEIPEKELIVRT